ncbi:MAG: hypothetical protein IKV65_04640 [Erysipelotrichaceae bacterium]|nr:hypothetical protein [Erysipelotrichaceae bacterium]
MRKNINIVLIGLLLMMHICQINATENTGVKYRILFDSREHNETELINQMIKTYHKLTLSVKRSDHAIIIRQHLDDFEFENAEVSFEQGVLTILQGNQKGSKIEGDFLFLDCSPEIEEVSWIMNWLNNENR